MAMSAWRSVNRPSRGTSQDAAKVGTVLMVSVCRAWMASSRAMLW
jgi:hypothetical protein